MATACLFPFPVQYSPSFVGSIFKEKSVRVQLRISPRRCLYVNTLSEY